MKTFWWLIAAGFAVGCSSPETRPAALLCDGGGCTGQSGGGGSPSGGTGNRLDAGGDAAVTSVSGVLGLYTGLPPGRSRVAAASGWTVQVANFSAGTLDPDPGVFVDGTGSFRLPVTPIAESLSDDSNRYYWLLATPPSTGGLRALFRVPEGTRAVTLNAANDDTFQTALVTSSVAFDPSRGHIAVTFREALLPDAQPVPNVLVDVEGQIVQPLYDNDIEADQLQTIATGTGSRGFAFIPNVSVSGGDGVVTLRVTYGATTTSRAHRVRVRAQAVSWLTLLPI